jgi:3'-5' exoribonuclease
MNMKMILKTKEEIEETKDWEKFKTILDSLGNRELAGFLAYFLGSHTRTGQMYFTAPGSRPGTGHGHHDYVGGLAKHSVSAAYLGADIVNHYVCQGEDINRDMVIAGILLHDVGKAWSYEPLNAEQTEWGHTHESQHLHHIPIGHKEFVKALIHWGHELDSELALQLEHIILSHHGKVSWSSPVTPRTTEAFIVHIIEMLDGFLEGKYFKGQPPRRLYTDN